MNNRPIGVFDSGLGGLTVLKEIMKITPNENIVYFGDTARVPYGPRSKETIIKYTFQAIDFLISKNVKAIVIACNTATARALKEANEKYDLPIIGVIEAGAKTAAYTTKNKIVGVIGTDGTIRSKAYNIEIAKIDPEIKIVDKACPLFVPIVEEGWANTDIASLTARRYLEELMDKGIDSLVLGCTHYPLLKRTIGEIVGENVKLVNPARETAKDLKRILENDNILREETEEDPKYEYYVSDIPEKFASIAEEFLKKHPEISMDELPVEAGKEDDYENIDLQRALNSMANEDKAVIQLRYFEDLKISQIAEILGENVNTIKSRLYRGLKKLKLELSDTWQWDS